MKHTTPLCCRKLRNDGSVFRSSRTPSWGGNCSRFVVTVTPQMKGYHCISLISVPQYLHSQVLITTKTWIVKKNGSASKLLIKYTAINPYPANVENMVSS